MGSQRLRTFAALAVSLALVVVLHGYAAGPGSPVAAAAAGDVAGIGLNVAQAHLEGMRKDNTAQLQGVAERLNLANDMIAQLTQGIAAINEMLQPTAVPATPHPTPSPPPPRFAGSPLQLRSISAVEKTESELELLVDGSFDHAVHIDDSAHNALAYLDFRFATAVPFRRVDVHMSKHRHTHPYSSLVVHFMRDDEVLFESSRMDWGYSPRDPHNFNNEEVHVKVPREDRIPANRVRITESNPGRKVLHLSEVVFYVDSDTIPTPTLFRRKRHVVWTTEKPLREELYQAKQVCRARNGTQVSVYTPDTQRNDKDTREGLVTVDKKFDCAIVSAVFGKVEKTLKMIVPQEHECDRIMFTDKTDLAVNETGWRVVNTPFHEYHAETKQFMGSHPEDVFLKAKFYKQQAHRLLPSHVKYLIWVDGTITFTDKHATTTIIKSLQTDASIGTTMHGSLDVMAEIVASIPKYHRGFNIFDYIVVEYNRAVQQGFCERFWDQSHAWLPHEALVQRLLAVGLAREGCPEQYRTLHTMMPLALAMLGNVTYDANSKSVKVNYTNLCKPMGTGVVNKEDLKDVLSAPMDQGLTMALTCVVSYDLRHRVVRDFLDDWWRTTFWHWQDQVTFPIMAWKFGILPKYLNNLLKDKDGNDIWEKLPHFQ